MIPNQYPRSTGQGMRCRYTPPDRTEMRITLAMRFCIGLAVVFLAGFFTRG